LQQLFRKGRRSGTLHSCDDRIRAHPADPGAYGKAEENQMGFMDKAKKLAEQAQQKLDEAQQNFNQSASPQPDSPEGAVRYDEHGRPIQETPPAGAAPPPSDEPAPTPPAAPVDEPEASESQPPPAEGGGQADASPDPFRPLQQ
jgi:hypothetical protein